MARKIETLRRSGQTRLPKRKFILFCEGEKTEPGYFAAFTRAYPTVLVEIQRAVGTPWTIATKAVEEAKARRLIGRRKPKESFERNDEVWAIFDRDEHPKFSEATQKCISSGIGVASSNPCFEVWLILHFQTYDAAGGRDAAQKTLQSICPDYDPKKGKSTDFAKLMADVEKAEARAAVQASNRQKEGDPNGEPSTRVHALVQRMRAG